MGGRETMQANSCTKYCKTVVRSIMYTVVYKYIIVYFIKRHIYNGIKKLSQGITDKLLGSLFCTNEILDKRAIRSLTKTSGTS